RILGDKAENIELAIAAFTNALELLTRTVFPVDWAATQNNLGNTYRNRILGDKAENIKLAIAAFINALEVRTRTAFPQNHVETLFNLGLVYQEAQRFLDAYNTYRDAIETMELLRGEIVSGDVTKRKQAEKWNELYRCMVEVCLELKEYTKAVEYIERSKTRNLVEQLFTHDSYPKVAIPEELKQQLQQLQQDIEQEKRRLEQEEKSNPQESVQPSAISNQLNLLRQQRERLITRIVGLSPISYSDIQNLLDEETAIIQWYIFNNCFRVFIITHDKEQPEIWESESQDLERLKEWFSEEYLKSYFEEKQRWRYLLSGNLNQLAEILHIQEVLSLIPSQYKKAIFVPHRYLHLLPLHALPLEMESQESELTQEYLMDRFPKGVSYAPSCQLLRFNRSQAEKISVSSIEFCNLFAIQNPTEDLGFTDIEVETVAKAFQPSFILKRSEATVGALKGYPTYNNFQNAFWLHFSCHGYFNFNLPEKSALQLADTLVSPVPENVEPRYLPVSQDAAIDLEKCLTLEDVFQLSLPHCRLVTLSACETGFSDFTSTSDEYIGLPSGFIRAGAASIVSSLWAVDDFSTSLLMIKFYENLRVLTQNVPIALNEAQRWFRQVTQSELVQWLDAVQDIEVEQKLKVKDRLEKYYKPEQQPFKHTWCWGAFCAMGE
ncbi:MAG: CHAT domain-containing protein, partial [Scytonema sp. PMC 1070.18]|nr:CHAT domain-containing protein [Scytonema sp. PMC 1070.18]